MNIQSLSKDELRALLTAARAARERDWLMILVAYWHGLRASEVVALTPDNFSDGFITVQRKKGSRRTTQPLVEDADPLLSERAAVFELTARLTSNQRLFPISRQHFWYLVQQHAETAGVPKHKAHPHALKHSVARHNIDSAGIHNVRQWLGHESIKSTGAYLEVTDEEAAAAILRKKE